MRGQRSSITDSISLTTKYQLLVRFLVTSRPEPHIEHLFDVSIDQSSSIVFSIYGHGTEHGDVYKFLQSKFDETSDSEGHASALRSHGLLMTSSNFLLKNWMDTLSTHLHPSNTLMMDFRYVPRGSRKHYRLLALIRQHLLN